MTPMVLETAADWFLRIRSPKAGVEEQIAWLHWIESDPAHRQAFDEIQESWDVAGGVRARPVKPTQASARVKWAWAASVVVACGLAALGWLWQGAETRERYATGRAEQQSAVLPDGSKVELGALTGITVSYTPTQRLIVADEGETFYSVARESGRPFVVRAGPVSVTALGTAFSVRREGSSVTVSVSDGLVAVRAGQGGSTAVRAEAGQLVRFDHGALARLAQETQMEPVTAWRRGRLRFEEESLRTVAANLSRYSRTQIEIADPQTAELKFTGTVFDDRVEDWLNGIQVVFPVKVRRVDARHAVIERVRP